MHHVLFIQGAGAGAYEEDARLADSLRQALGSSYEIRYPRMPNEDDAPYAQWVERIERELAEMRGPVVVVAHSVGASVLLKYLSAGAAKAGIAGAFFIANPFWGGEGWRYEGWEELASSPPLRLGEEFPVFLYHCRDDEVVPFEHLALYARMLPRATVRALDSGGHQLNDDLSVVAADVRWVIAG